VEVEEVEEVVVDEAQEGRATEEGIEDETERIKSLEGANGWRDTIKDEVEVEEVVLSSIKLLSLWLLNLELVVSCTKAEMDGGTILRKAPTSDWFDLAMGGGFDLAMGMGGWWKGTGDFNCIRLMLGVTPLARITADDEDNNDEDWLVGLMSPSNAIGRKERVSMCSEGVVLFNLVLLARFIMFSFDLGTPVGTVLLNWSFVDTGSSCSSM
jgi:hypothetical protein